MVKREKNSIYLVKKHLVIKVLIWISIIIALFKVGLHLYQTKANVYTLVSCVFALPLAQHLTRLIVLLKYKDPTEENALLIESLGENCFIYHGVILPQSKNTLYFPHILLIEDDIYFFASGDQIQEQMWHDLKQRLTSKGMDQRRLHLVKADTKEKLKLEIDALTPNLQKISKNIPTKNMHILEGMFM